MSESGTSSSGPGPSAVGATATFEVSGMHCGSCVALIEETLVEQVGVESAAVDLASTRAVVTFDPTVIAVEQLQAAITEVGYTATPAG